MAKTSILFRMNERQIHILGAKIDLLSRQEVSDRIGQWLQHKKGHYIVTLNPEIALLAEREDGFQKVLNRSDITVADGIGLRIAARIFGIAVPPRITGRQIIDILCKAAIAQKKSLYLLGAGDGVATKAGEVLRRMYPGLRVAGAEQGFAQGVEPSEGDVKAVCSRIDASQADIVLVAFGAPKQERFITQNLKHMTSVKIAVGVGGLFDYLTGVVPAPSVFWRKYGLEWLFRLITQPKRWKRIFNATIVFLTRVMVWKYRIKFKFRRNVVGFIQDRSHSHALLVSPWWAQDKRWQFPQGGIDSGESAQAAVLREMGEELGTSAFKILTHIPNVHVYEWPTWYTFVKGYKGQNQDLFVLEFIGKDEDIDLAKAAELHEWRWVSNDHVLSQLAQPRREIGALALEALAKVQ